MCLVVLGRRFGVCGSEACREVFVLSRRHDNAIDTGHWQIPRSEYSHDEWSSEVKLDVCLQWDVCRRVEAMDLRDRYQEGVFRQDCVPLHSSKLIFIRNCEPNRNKLFWLLVDYFGTFVTSRMWLRRVRFCRSSRENICLQLRFDVT